MLIISWLRGKPKPLLILRRGEQLGRKELVRKDRQQNLVRKELVRQELVRQDQQQNLLSQCWVKKDLLNQLSCLPRHPTMQQDRPYTLLPSSGRGQGSGSGMMR